MTESQIAYDHHMTLDEYKTFKSEWDNAVGNIKKSNADLSRINIVTDDEKKEKARRRYAERRRKRLLKNL